MAEKRNDEIAKAVQDAAEYLDEKARKEPYGDITVTITMRAGVPVKMFTTFCQFRARTDMKRFNVVEK